MPAPRIIPRSEWSDVHPTWSDLVLPTPKAILHHQGGTFTKSANLEDLKAALRAIEHGEMNRGDGLIAIAYHWWVVNGGPFDGLVFELRPVGKQGGATYHQNAVSHAVCVSGDFTFDVLTAKAFASICWLFAQMELTGFITKGAGVTPHSIYFPTACPGVKLRSELVRINTEVTHLIQPTQEVRPMFSPPVAAVAITSFHHPTIGECSAAVTTEGAIYCNPPGAYLGGGNHGASQGKDFYDAGRRAASVRRPTVKERADRLGYVIVATSGETYGFFPH